MDQVDPHIPEIFDAEMREVVRRIKPVASFTTLPLGKYPQDDISTYWLKLPRSLRNDNFLQQSRKLFGRVRLVQAAEICTLHTPGQGEKEFHPTIAEVLAQIPAKYLNPYEPTVPRIVAFTTVLYDKVPRFQGSFHIARTILLSR